MIHHDIFAFGWLNDETQSVSGRPVDIVELPDGSIVISDDSSGVLYRVTYTSEVSSSDAFSISSAFNPIHTFLDKSSSVSIRSEFEALCRVCFNNILILVFHIAILNFLL